jgi:N-acetylneuraminic acid mutarotase
MRSLGASVFFWAAAFFGALLVGAAEDSRAAAQTGPGVWAKRAPLSGVRSETAIAVVDGKIYLIGGNTVEMRNGMAVDRYDAGLAEEYDPGTDRWRTLAPMPNGAGHAAIAVMDGKIYVAGGFKVRQHMQAIDGFYAYDPKTGTWETLPALLSPRGSPNLAAVGGKLHIFGGRVDDRSGPTNAHEIYDPATRKWTPARQLPTARDHMGIGIFDGKIHVVGGRTGGNEDANTGAHEIYDPQTGIWSVAAPMPTPRSGGAFAIYRGLLLFIGGECINRTTYDENEAYDPRTGKWVTLAPLPVGRHAESAEAVGDTLYVIGGATGCGGVGKTTDNLTFTLR